MEKDFEKSSIPPGFENWLSEPHPAAQKKKTEESSKTGIKNHGFSSKFRPEKGEGIRGKKYAAEIDRIKKEIGDIEIFRARLGLSRRKICDLLMVDPSAWTRWTKPGSDAPPHIYRALEWLDLLEKRDEKKPTWQYQVQSEIGGAQREIRGLQRKIQSLRQSRQRKTKWLLYFAGFAHIFTWGWLLLK